MNVQVYKNQVDSIKYEVNKELFGAINVLPNKEFKPKQNLYLDNNEDVLTRAFISEGDVFVNIYNAGTCENDKCRAGHLSVNEMISLLERI